MRGTKIVGSQESKVMYTEIVKQNHDDVRPLPRSGLPRRQWRRGNRSLQKSSPAEIQMRILAYC
jgi:hypothetical protein